MRRDYNYPDLHRVLTREWQHTNTITEEIGWTASAVRRYLNVLAMQGRVTKYRNSAGLWWKLSNEDPSELAFELE